MKKIFLLVAMVCALWMMTACKSGTAEVSDSLEMEEICMTPPGYMEYMDSLSRSTFDSMNLDTVLFTASEIDAEFPGGEDSLRSFLRRMICYPEETRQSETKGYVCVCFVVERDGTITGAELKHDSGVGMGEEVLRVVNLMPKWSPGRHSGFIRKNVPVRLRTSLVVHFPLTED